MAGEAIRYEGVTLKYLSISGLDLGNGTAARSGAQAGEVTTQRCTTSHFQNTEWPAVPNTSDPLD